MGIKGKTGKYKRTPEMLKNYSEAAKHRNYTEEGKRKISEATKKAYLAGRVKVPSMLGRKISEDILWKWRGKPRHSKPHSEETKKRISSLKKEQYKNNPQLLESAREAGIKGILRQAAQKEPTSIEKAVYDYLICKGVIFEKQVNVGNRFVVDAYIPSLNIIIEADGDYWHSTPRGIITDKRKNEYLIKKGYKIIRLLESEIRSGSFKEKLKF